MHGYQHLYHPSNKKDSIVPFYNRSEFTGLSLEIQREKIRVHLHYSIEIILSQKYGLPSHSFDKNTIKALEAETDIKIVSDGIAIYPYRYEGMNYIPQQLDIKLKSIGIWTICLHPDTMTMDQITDLQEKLKDTRISNNLILINDVVFQSDQKTLLIFSINFIFYSVLEYRGILAYLRTSSPAFLEGDILHKNITDILNSTKKNNVLHVFLIVKSSLSNYYKNDN